MDTKFEAWVIDTRETDRKRMSLRTLSLADLPAGEVTVKVEYSSINYKDALAVVGAGRIIRIDECIPGVDLAGSVVASDDSSFKIGTKVIATGWGLGEKRHGGYAGYARLPGRMLTPLPANLSAFEAMCFGTAGLTAMLAIRNLENCNSLKTDSQVLVTSAGGGVGSISVALLAQMGLTPSAVSRPKNIAYIKQLGAIDIINRSDFIAFRRSLAHARWDAGIDTAGGQVLATLLTEIKPGKTVVCCGLTAGAELTMTVMPFILRGINLHGIDSVHIAPDLRIQTWQRIADLRAALKPINIETVALADVPEAATRLINAQIRGRLVVKIGDAN